MVTQIHTSLLEKINNLNLSQVYFNNVKIVFEKGERGAWDEYGVRDPALLTDEDGNILRNENNQLVMYYTGSRYPDGIWQATGICISSDEGHSWKRILKDPVLQPTPGSWDETVSSTPWVIKGLDGLYRMYYRGLSTHHKDDAIGVAISSDGINFTKYENNPILKHTDFKDMRSLSQTLMGVTHITKTHSGEFLLSFEGYSKKEQGSAAIFGAISKDGANFTPFNDGFPLFSASMIKNWKVKHVANPRVTYLKPQNLYMLCYNAYYENKGYGLGLAFSEDLKNWIDHPYNPVLLPSLVPEESPLSGRLEGGIIPLEDIFNKSSLFRMFLMAIPRKGPSHHNSAIALATSKKDAKKVLGCATTHNTVHSEDSNGFIVTESDKQNHLNRYHINLKRNPHVERITFTFQTSPGAVAYLCLEKDPSLPGCDQGVKIFLSKEQCQIYGETKVNTLFKLLIGKRFFRKLFPVIYNRIFKSASKLLPFKQKEWNAVTCSLVEKKTVIEFNKNKTEIPLTDVNFFSAYVLAGTLEVREFHVI
jgi:predicted GH43/DUF377 family glycosyl hydrolase